MADIMCPFMLVLMQIILMSRERIYAEFLFSAQICKEIFRLFQAYLFIFFAIEQQGGAVDGLRILHRLMAESPEPILDASPEYQQSSHGKGGDVHGPEPGTDGLVQRPEGTLDNDARRSEPVIFYGF